jgi:hypothetical protein
MTPQWAAAKVCASRRPRTRPVDGLWTHELVVGLAHVRCELCRGLGQVSLFYSKVRPCRCVYRAIFRAGVNRYLACGMSSRMPRMERGMHYGRRGEEFRADMLLLARRSLREQELWLFEAHYLAGWPWRPCSQALGLSRQAFFREIYILAERMGRLMAELQPYPLWPISEYFARGLLSTSVEIPLSNDPAAHGRGARSHGEGISYARSRMKMAV